MALVALDTSVIVPALVAWHPRHELAAKTVEDVFDSVVVLVPSLIESYSVLTRMPAPHRLSAADAFAVLSLTFRDARVVAFHSDIWAFLQNLADTNISGGVVYDAVILDAARAAGATVLLTFNPRDFERLGIDGIEIVVPT
jgi:predicted nucleic acid-binding protein